MVQDFSNRQVHIYKIIICMVPQLYQRNPADLNTLIKCTICLYWFCILRTQTCKPHQYTIIFIDNLILYSKQCIFNIWLHVQSCTFLMINMYSYVQTCEIKAKIVLLKPANIYLAEEVLQSKHELLKTYQVVLEMQILDNCWA